MASSVDEQQPSCSSRTELRGTKRTAPAPDLTPKEIALAQRIRDKFQIMVKCDGKPNPSAPAPAYLSNPDLSIDSMGRLEVDKAICTLENTCRLEEDRLCSLAELSEGKRSGPRSQISRRPFYHRYKLGELLVRHWHLYKGTDWYRYLKERFEISRHVADQSCNIYNLLRRHPTMATANVPGDLVTTNLTAFARYMELYERNPEQFTLWNARLDIAPASELGDAHGDVEEDEAAEEEEEHNSEEDSTTSRPPPAKAARTSRKSLLEEDESGMETGSQDPEEHDTDYHDGKTSASSSVCAPEEEEEEDEEEEEEDEEDS